MKRIIAFLLALAVLLPLTACGANERQENLAAQLRKKGFSGVILMTRNGKTVCEIAQGVENEADREPITMDTLFCVGSVSKQFTAAAVMMLYEEGKLRLDEPLDSYFPGCAYGKELTLRHLLTMRSGIAEFYDVVYIDNAFTELPTGSLRGVVTNRRTAAENRETLEKWLLEQPLVFAPGTAYAYCNSNYFLLARIVELVSGTRFNDFIRERIFETLGMTHSTFIDDVDLHALPHLAMPTVTPQTVYVGITMGLGDMISNARDIDRWLTSLRTHELLTAESVRMMMTDYSPEEDAAYGFGLIPYRGGAYHFGYITTYQAMVYTDPAAGVNLFAVTNDDPNPDISLPDIGWSLVRS